MMNWRKILMEKTDLQIPEYKDEFNINCPFHDDRSPSLSVNLSKGLYICHAGCSQGTLKEFLIQYLGTRMFTLPHEEDYDSVFNIDDSEIEEEIGELPEVVCPFDFNNFPAWILDRGFKRPTISKWGFGKNCATGSLVIPIKDSSSRLVGWACRRAGKKKPKYVYSEGLRKSHILFGEHLVKSGMKSICITEGPLDTIWLDQNGFSSVALLGLYMSSAQEKRLKNLKVGEYVVCLDNDIEGRVATRRVGQELSKYAVVSYIQLPDLAKDVQDVREKEKIVSIINNRTCFGGF